MILPMMAAHLTPSERTGIKFEICICAKVKLVEGEQPPAHLTKFIERQQLNVHGQLFLFKVAQSLFIE